MLNRKISNYLFYFFLVAIVLTVFAVRTVTIGGINDKIDTLETSNIILQAQIGAIEELVEDNKDIQISHLYELYNQVPNIFSRDSLIAYTDAQLELVEVTQAGDMQRNVELNEGVTFPGESAFSLLQLDFKVVEVKVSFSTDDEQVIQDFIELLFNSDQIFIINHIEYFTPDGEDYIHVSIDFLAFYDKEDAS